MPARFLTLTLAALAAACATPQTAQRPPQAAYLTEYDDTQTVDLGEPFRRPAID